MNEYEYITSFESDISTKMSLSYNVHKKMKSI